ncbi:unnamed protein product, partial [Brenthis ino]
MDNESKCANLSPGREKNSKNKFKSRGAKRKRINSSSSTDGDDILPENTFDVEKNLCASAIKNNLDDVSVKKILKKVVTNDHVLALVKMREEEENSWTENNLRPKITRAKAKELMKVSPKCAPWNLDLTPIKHIPVKTRPEVKALIAQELPEDEDDDEYEPTHDDVPSDDDHVLESCSDLDSQPRTPATPKSQKKASPKIVQDGPFKVPQGLATPVCRKLNLDEEEATIALRTRSKVSLTETSIEHLESSFVPPDDLPVTDVDDLWNEFLNECLNPAPVVRNEEDDETDPEYNVAADPDANEEDEETLENSIIKISRKELNDLVTELFHVMPEVSDEQLQEVQSVLDQEKTFEVNLTPWEVKQESISDEEKSHLNMAGKIKYEKRFSVGKTEVDDNHEVLENVANNNHTAELTVSVNESVPDAIIEQQQQAPTKVTISIEESEGTVRPPPQPPQSPPAPLKGLLAPETQVIEIQLDESVKLYPEQVQVLQQQLRQHVQLAAGNFLQLYVHPTLWQYAPQYKEYLQSLNNMTVTNPKSVVNVCNLKPALDLIGSWEKTLSENPQDAELLVAFLTKEVEKYRRRTAQNSMYMGDFHEMFKKVVANSPVFLYPYLLPPMPYRADFAHKRSSYLNSEDQLIVLGLDQFWQYIKENPGTYRLPRHARRRAGLTAAARLACRYSLPGVSLRALLSHVQAARHQDADGPIARYFKKNEIDPVKHKLLPFNPKLTLYEQPESEMPHLWIKYLAKSSKRFRNHLYRRPKATAAPAGIDVEIGKHICNKEKSPLPIDFTKEITCNRSNILPKIQKPNLVDRVDVQIQATTRDNMIVASNIYRLVNTSSGTHLIPLLVINTNTVNSTTTPICTPAPVNTNIDNGNIDSNNCIESNTNLWKIDSVHCKCCRLLRKFVKRPTLITDYFGVKKRDVTCDCINRQYPNISNKLKILINNFKKHYNVVNDGLSHKIEEYMVYTKRVNGNEEAGCSSKDIETAMKFQIKLIERCNIARNNQIKRSLHTTFMKFDIYNDEVLELYKKMSKIFDVELVDIYKEFLGFLTAEQADKMDVFKDYFIWNCVEDLIEKIEEKVPDNRKKYRILEKIKEVILDNSLKPCDICYKLLECTQEFPELMKYIFSLFPHRRRQFTRVPDKSFKEKIEDQDDTMRTCDDTNATINYEADNSSSDDEEQKNNEGEKEEEEEEEEDEEEEEEDEGKKEEEEGEESGTPPSPASSPARQVFMIKDEQGDESEITITETKVQGQDDSDMSALIMSEDECIKEESPEWHRDEDKLILEVLKHYLTSAKIKDKTLLEIIEEKNIISMIADSLHKSMQDVKGRILYLLQILIENEINK